MRNLVFVADAHIENRAKDVFAFRDFLRDMLPCTHTLVILGDLFNLWIAKKRLEQDYHSEIINQLRVMRMSGVRLIYLEGNRDFHIRHCYLGDPFDEVSDNDFKEEFDGRCFYLHHGDMVNRDDKMYLLWRRFAKSRAIWKLFNIFPLSVEVMIARNLERALRGSNVKHKSYFPSDRCREFAECIFQKGFDIAVIGHLHREEALEFSVNGRKKYFYSLPAWKEEKRYLLFEPGRDGKFVNFSS